MEAEEWNDEARMRTHAHAYNRDRVRRQRLEIGGQKSVFRSATQGFWVLTSLAVAVCVIVGVAPVPVTVKV